GPKYVLIYGSLVSMTGFWLMINYRATPLQLVIDSFITGVGVVSIMIPMVNMIAVSMPPENVAVGLGFNTMVRFLGSSVGPVLAATFMTDYKYYVVYGTTASVFKEMFSEAGTLAFNYIFLTGLIFSFLTLIVSFFADNYKSKNLSVTK
ncbi:MAG: MFS transporter, partial [Nitrososphaeria archaeon]